MLKLVTASQLQATPAEKLKTYGALALTHHNQLLNAYLQSHSVRNHSPRTIEETKRFLNGWFLSHGNESRTLFTWEAMAPVHGRNRIAAYAVALKDAELTSHTMRKYLGMLRGYFSYVLEHPYIFDGERSSRVAEIYSSIEQPVSEYDIPVHSFDGEQQGVPLEPSRLYEFYNCLRQHYINPSCRRYHHERARNYAMVILAGETGLRSDEMAHLEVEHDLFFDSRQLQTRFAKGTNGSGKRARLTVFPPLARDTIRYYLKNHRPHLRGAQSPYLFCSTQGGPIDYNSLQRAIVSIRACANKNQIPVLDHFAWHWLRRLFATRFIERFPDKLPVLIQVLGHVTGQTVHKYIRHSKAWMDNEIRGVLEHVELGDGEMEI
jgi:integrase